MSKRYSRSKSKNIFVRIAGWIASIIMLIWKSTPVLVIAAIFYFSFFGVNDLLSSDQYFQIARLKIFPRGILTDQEYGELERRATGVNLLKVDLKQLSAVMLANPKVKRADINRKLPNELEIFLTPRKAVYQLRTSPRGAYYALGEDGVVMRTNETRDLSLLQFLHFDYPVKRLHLLDRYQDAAWRKLGAILDFLAKHNVTKAEKVETVLVDKTGSFSVLFAGGPELLLRDSDDLTNQKMMALGNLLASQERNSIAYIDLRQIDLILKYK